MAYLHISVESAKATRFLAKCRDDEYPKGLSHVEWKNLNKKYLKTDILSASKSRQELHILKLK